MAKRRDFIKGSQVVKNDWARRIKIEAWKNFISFRNNEFPFSSEQKREIMNALEIFLNRTVDNINFEFRDIRRQNFICKKSKYNFFGQDLDCWLIRLIITSNDLPGINYKWPREFRLIIKIFMNQTAFYNSTYEVEENKDEEE